jgi:hypothetical protein
MRYFFLSSTICSITPDRFLFEIFLLDIFFMYKNLSLLKISMSNLFSKNYRLMTVLGKMKPFSSMI